MEGPNLPGSETADPAFIFIIEKGHPFPCQIYRLVVCAVFFH
jgi:hypothetical protein